jgi:hypothetical protein
LELEFPYNLDDDDDDDDDDSDDEKNLVEETAFV